MSTVRLGQAGKIVGYVIAYLMWIIDLLLGLWFGFISREVILDAFTIFYIKESIPRAWQVRFIDKVYVIIIGLLWLVLMIVVEEYYRKSVSSNRLFFSVAKVTGPLLLLCFLADFLLLLLQGPAFLIWERWLLLAIELGAGGILVWYSRSHKPASPGRIEAGEAG